MRLKLSSNFLVKKPKQDILPSMFDLEADDNSQDTPMHRKSLSSLQQCSSEAPSFTTCHFLDKSDKTTTLTIRIDGKALVLTHDDIADPLILVYPLSKVQILPEVVRGAQCSFKYSLLIIKQSRHRHIYFQSEEAMRYWQEMILRQQGFWECRAEQYELLEMIGKGSYGKVYLAEHKNSHATYAIKSVFKPRLRGAQTYIEPELMEKLSSLQDEAACFIKTYETFETDTHHYIVMEHMEGGTLINYASKQKRFPLSEAIVKPIVKQIAQSLSTLHSMNVIHRDVKFDNILMARGDNTLKLADFGSAAQLATKEATEDLRVGTVGFFAPEVILKQPYGTAVDIFSLGCLSYALLVDQVLYIENGESQLRYFERLLNEPVENQLQTRTLHISDEARDLLYGMLARDPSLRLTAAQVLRHPWFL